MIYCAADLEGQREIFFFFPSKQQTHSCWFFTEHLSAIENSTDFNQGATTEKSENRAHNKMFAL